ncbi:MAG TPA: hypothetical protein ENJ09_01565 [Planctomycetes bacterium]|nr:hypothetical protein [Planctomycetota bacterium]
MRRLPPERALSSDPSRGAISFLGATALTAIVAVLIFVSLPRLRSFVCLENESEARELAVALAKVLETDPPPDGEPLLLEELVRAEPDVAALGDEDFFAGGRLLRRHGYLFAVVPVAAPVPAPAPRSGEVLAAESAPRPGTPRLAVRAWPWKRGRTGRAAFLAFPGGELWTLEGGPACPEGPRAGLEALASWEGWRRTP